jgi:hypothetical protein
MLNSLFHRRAILGRHRWLLSLIIFMFLFGASQDLFAEGKELVKREEDIVLAVDSRWPGNAYGGYFPFRIKLSNMGPPRVLTVWYEGRDTGRSSRMPKVVRAVQVEQQATINFTLSVPMVSQGTEGTIRVEDTATGEELKGLSSYHSLPGYGGHQPRTSLLIISTAPLDDVALKPFEDAAVTECAYASGIWHGSGAGHSMAAYSSSRVSDQDHQVLAPTGNLPVNWVDYSGVDLVAVAWSDWDSKLSAAERDAILKWTTAGGVLMIFGAGKPAAQNEDLNRSLHVAHVPTWTNCVPESHRATTIVTGEMIRSAGYSGGGPVTTATKSVITSVPAPEGAAEAATDAYAWKISNDTYSQRDWMLGKIYVFPQNPFPGTANDWAWWLASLPKGLSHWPKKLGMSARTDNAEFLNFLIPGVGTVPVFAFLTLITVFTIVIGPLNYYWLQKRRRLAAMVLTVPLLAGVTCVLLFAYSLISDGFSTRSRVHSFTWLDQERKSAVALSRICLYAPFAPSSGLNFSPECAVFPIWQSATGFENGVVDWSGNDQRMTSGWLRSQTWTQFQTIEHRDERGRLDFTLPSDPNAQTLKISNGLSWDLNYVAINTSGSTWFAGQNVPAGATAELKRQSARDAGAPLVTILGDHAWKYPEGMLGPTASAPRYGPTYGRFGWEQKLETNFSLSLLKRYIPNDSDLSSVPMVETFDWRDSRNNTNRQQHEAAKQPHYWAVCSKNSAIQTGVKSSLDQGSLHILFGTF